jgi:hypothetical protein
MNRAVVRLVVWFLTAACVPLCVAGCSDGAAQRSEPIGTMEMTLLGASTSGKVYRLRNGIIAISGTSITTVNTEDHLAENAIQLELKEGGYLAELETGWTLERQDAGVFGPVNAVLTSTNPLPFTVVDQQTTSVRFQFNAGDDVVDIGNGRVVIGIDVEDCDVGNGNVCDTDGDGFAVPADCDDTDPDVFPGAAETCDGKDNDCDGQVDAIGLVVQGDNFHIDQMIGTSPLGSTVNHNFGFTFQVPEPLIENRTDDTDPLCMFGLADCPKQTVVQGEFTFQFSGQDAATFNSQGADHWTHGLAANDALMAVTDRGNGNFETYIYLLPDDTEQFFYWHVRFTHPGGYVLDANGFPIIDSTVLSSAQSVFFDFRGSNQANLLASGGILNIQSCP